MLGIQKDEQVKGVSEEQAISFHKMLVEHYIENIPEDCSKKIIYVLKGDGVWQVRKNNIGTFTVQVAVANIPGLKKDFKETWELNVPLIPLSLLESAISFFREIYKQHGTEAHVQFFYNVNTEEYILHCPKQEVSPGSVRYERDKNFEKPHLIFVLEMHSHGSMGAFFSGTDDKDEKDDRFYGVVGKVGQFQPEMKFRLSVGGHKFDLEVGDIFDLRPVMDDKNFPKKWLKKISKRELEVFDLKSLKPMRNRQLNLLDKHYSSPDDDDEIFGLMEDRLYPTVMPEESDYYLKDGDKTWLIQDNERVCYFDSSGNAHPVDEEDDDGTKELDFHHWRERDF
jgi:PRTRC genetic system protein A